MNGVHQDTNAIPAGPSSPFDFSDDGADGDSHDEHPGDYSTRFEELMSDAENGTAGHEDSDEEGFLYTGVDADELQGGYREQLRDVLGPEHEDDLEEVEVERSLVHDVEENEKFAASLDDEARVRCLAGILVVHPVNVMLLCSTQVHVHLPRICIPRLILSLKSHLQLISCLQ